jgi:peptide/nickel transport system permease protein
MSVSASSVPLVLQRTRRRVAASTVVYAVCWVIVGLAVLMAIFGPLLAPHDPNFSQLEFQFVGPFQAKGYLLGFDSQGRDLLSRLMVGARTSMLGPFLVVVLSMALGVVISTVAAWRGGWTDSALGTVMDILFAFPGILLAVLAAAVFGAGLTAAATALAIAYMPYVARVLRGAALKERSQPYIAALEVHGASATTICLRHIIPNIAPLIVAQATIMFGYAMVDLAAVSYLGLGVQPPAANWGVMISENQVGIPEGYPLPALAAGACIVAVVIAFNVLGERLFEQAQGAR